jgi:nucleoside 2-deoxyribosyltransferase
MKVYIAGKVSKDSSFGTHHWRDAFCAQLTDLSGVQLENLDPLKQEEGRMDYREIFAKDCQLINQCDAFIVYLSDDISVGGSQEILIARYLKKPVLGLAPTGGKFNGSRKEMLGQVIDNYQDPFVFSTCDVVCGSIEELADALQHVGDIQSTGLAIIDAAIV